MIAIAIDGPSAAGKSTIARRVAADCSFIYVDTGALYRAIGLFVLEKGVSTMDEQAVTALLSEIDAQIVYREGAQRIMLNGKDVSEDIRRPEMSMAASNVSAFPSVRQFLLELQRNLARKNNVVMDGRDIGTVVLPDAKVKIFLTASPEERTRRRQAEFLQKGINVDYDALLAETILRDKNDMSRPIAPLKQAEDAVLVDTSAFTLEESVAVISQIIREKL